MGSGTTLVEAKLLNRNAVGVDINPQSVSISDANLQFQCDTSSKVYTCNGNAANLHFIKDNSIDLIRSEEHSLNSSHNVASRMPSSA